MLEVLLYKQSVSSGSFGRFVCGPDGSCDLRLLDPCTRKSISWQILTLISPKTTLLSPPPHHVSRKLIFFLVLFSLLLSEMKLVCSDVTCTWWLWKPALNQLLTQAAPAWVTNWVLCFWIYDVMKIHFIFTWKELVFAHKTFIISTVKAIFDFWLDCRETVASEG